jgi:hypothetical protein
LDVLLPPGQETEAANGKKRQRQHRYEAPRSKRSSNRAAEGTKVRTFRGKISGS